MIEPIEPLKAVFAVYKQEREEFGSIVKIKRNCEPEVNRYIARLKRRRKAVTERIDTVLETSPSLVSDIAKLKAERNLLKELIIEFEQADRQYNILGKQMADIQDKLKKKQVDKEKHPNSIPPRI